MKHKKVAKIGIVFALVISIVMNSAGNLFAQQEMEIEEVTTEGYESDIEEKEEVKEEGIVERERPSEFEDLSIDKQEESSDQEEESAMYTLSKNKFRDIHVTYPDMPNNIPFFDTVKFTDEPLPAGVTSVDLSENGDGSVIGGVEGEGTNQSKLIVTTNTPGEKVKFPRDSSYLFVSFLLNDPSNGIAPLERNVIDLSKVDTSEVTDMQGMFAGVEISRLDLSSFDTRNVRDMSRMFEKCRKLTEVDLSSFYTYFVMDMSYMFAECSSLTNLDINHFNIAYVTWMDGMFQNCTSIVDIDISNFSSSHLLGISAMFSGCSSLKNLDITNFRTGGVLYMDRLFEGCRSLTNLDLSTLDTKAVKNMYRMFAECTSLRELDLTNFNTENVMNMDSMFKDSTSLINLNLTNFNTQNVKKMNHMFYGCTSLERVDVTNFNTENVQTMWSMFGDCRSLTTLDVSNFNTQNVEQMNYMFYNTSLEELNLSNFNTSKVVNMEGMFQGNNTLTQLNLSNFDTSKVINMKYMLQNCSSLVILDLTNFSTPQVTNMMEMFNGCSSLTTIYSEEWDTSQVVNDTEMFLGCENVVGKSEYAITTPFDPNRIGKEVATPNNGYFTVPNLEEWNATVKYVDEDNQVLVTKGFLTTNRKPEITTEKLNEFMPYGYELVDENTSLTVTQDGQVFEIEIRKIPWILELEYQTVDGTVVKTEAIQVTQLNPVVTAQVITEKVPTGYELAEQVSDWTAAANGEKKVIQVREIPWTVTLEYQTVDGNVVKTEAIQVIQLNPVVTTQTITEKVPTGYELVDPASDWTATSNGDKKVIQVRAIEWTVNLEYQAEDGTVVKTEAIQVTQLNPVVPAQAITEKVPTGYELAEEAADWTATSNGDKKVIQVREIGWTVNLEYQTEDGNVVKTESIHVTQLNPVVVAQMITEKVPTGYELAEEVADWTATSNGEKKVIQVRAIEWTINLEYQTEDGTVVKTESIHVTQLNPVVTAQTITEKVPTGYELIDSTTDWTATSNGDKKVIQVREIEWTVNLEYQTEDGTVVKTESIHVTQLNPVVTAQVITEKVPTGYELIDSATDWAATSNGDKKIIQVREIEWTISLEYQTADGIIVKTEAIQVAQLNPVVTAQMITEKVPTGYELVDPATDWVVATNGDKKVIQVCAIEWTVNLEYQTVEGAVVKEEQIQVTQPNPVVTAQTITEKVPIGYELVDPASDWAATSNGDKKIIQVREIEWTVNLEYQTADGTVIKTESIQVTQLNPVITAQSITEKVPTGYELVNSATDWTPTANGEKKVIQIREVEWEVNLEYQTADGNVVKAEALQVTQLNPVVTEQVITEKVPTGYELITPATDWTANSNGDKKVIQVRAIEWAVSLEYQTTDGTIVKTETIQVTQVNPIVTEQTITDRVPTGYELAEQVSDWTVAANGDKKVIQIREVEWEVNLEYQTADGNVVKTEAIQVTQLNPVVTAQTITEKVPTGYELVDPATDWTATSNGDKKVIQVREIEWIVSLEYQTEDGTVIKEEQIQVTQLNPIVIAQTITDRVPTGYELVTPATDWTATANEEKKVIQVREIEWEITIEFITENAKGIVKTVTFTVGNLNPVIEAQQIMGAIPEGYYAPNEIQDLIATKDGEVFQIAVVKIEEWEGIVHFVDQNGNMVKTEIYKVTNKEPMIRVEELEKALPIGAISVKPLEEIIVTKDKEEFIIEVVMPIEEESNQPEIGGDDDTITDADQPEGSIEGIQTGDTTQAGLWAAIMSGSIGILAYLKRKKKSI